jgi:hypothetical protein
MKLLYHITKAKYLPSIIDNGLICNSKNNGFVDKKYVRSYYDKYLMQPIFLTNDIDFLIKNQLTKNFIKNNDCYVLKINCDNIILEDEYEYLKLNWNKYYCDYNAMINNTKKYFGKTFICKSNINSSLIYEYNKLK